MACWKTTAAGLNTFLGGFILCFPYLYRLNCFHVQNYEYLFESANVSYLTLCCFNEERFRSLKCSYIKHLSIIPIILSYKTTLEIFTIQSHLAPRRPSGTTLGNVWLDLDTKVRLLKDPRDSAAPLFLTIPTALVNIFSVFTNNTCVHINDVKK